MLEHYPLYGSEESTPSEVVYLFESESHGTYLISFSNANHRFKPLRSFNQQVYEIRFNPLETTEERKGHDPRIACTIIKAVEIFLESYASPLLYMCAMDDKRHECRLRLFKNWISRSKSEFYKHAAESIEVWGYGHIFGIITFTHDKDLNTYFAELDSYKEYL